MNKVASGDFGFTPQDFEYICKTLYDETGIKMDQSKSNLVYSRLTKRLRALGLESFRDYCSLIAEDGSEEHAKMCSALTTNVTKFFREKHHFEHFKKFELPKLIALAKSGKKVRIWSAGCSSGEEPYSIALTILSKLPDARAYDIKILATDFNPNVLAVGIAGHYPADEMKDVERELREQWMDEINVDREKHLQLDDAVLRLVSFKQLNLMSTWPMKGTFHIIFCRNVVIYFDDQTQSRIWQRMMPLLDNSGMLYIGHSERVSGPATSQTHCEGTTAYRKILRSAA
jgi:chemotaxis protein methyltransferase CheR